MPDKCWSVLSAERSAASIARALPSRRISTAPASTRSPSLAQQLDPHVGDRAPGRTRRRCRARRRRSAARAVHLRGEARVRGDRRLRRDVAARAEILGQHAANEIVEVEACREAPWAASRRARLATSSVRRLGAGQRQCRPASRSAGRRPARSSSPFQALTVIVTSSVVRCRCVLKLCSCSRTRVEVAVPAWTTSTPPARVTRSPASWLDAWCAWPASSMSTPESSTASSASSCRPIARSTSLADLEREQGMVGDEDPHRLARRCGRRSRG